MVQKVKKGLFVVVFTVLLLPLLQQNVLFIDCGSMRGYYTEAPEANLTVRNWFKDSLQIQETNYLNDHYGLRPYSLRLNGQIDYSFLQKMDYSGAVLGSNNYLYYGNYIEAYYGLDYSGYDQLYEQTRKLKALQDTFAKMGKLIVAVYAPCKAWFYPEHIPIEMRSSETKPNNYKTCVRIGDSLGVKQIDLNQWYLSLKDTSKEVLYPKWGIHWTNYGSILGADTIIRYIEREQHIHMPHPAWTKAVHTTEARDPDNDIGSTLNLLVPPKTDVLCYPELYYQTDASTTKPNLIFVGDSYSINFIRTGVMQGVSNKWQMWFVFKNVVDSSNYVSTAYTKMENYDWKSEMKKADCIIVLNTAKNANILGNGFIQEAYAYYFPGK